MSGLFPCVCSVVIPTFDRERLISRAIDSVLQQETSFPFEIIVVDDGSVDRTVELLGSYGNQIQILCQKNAGPANARNTGVRHARGEYIAFLDSDDLMLPHHLQSLCGFLIHNPDVVLAFGDLLEEGHGSVPVLERVRNISFLSGWTIIKDPFRYFTGGFLCSTPCAVFRRVDYWRVGGMRDDLRCAEDLDLFMRLGLLGAFAHICLPVAIYLKSQSDHISESQNSFSDPRKQLQRFLVEHRAELMRRGVWLQLVDRLDHLTTRYLNHLIRCGDSIKLRSTIRELGRQLSKRRRFLYRALSFVPNPVLRRLPRLTDGVKNLIRRIAL